MAIPPLILAIEPDHRQASCLSSVARRISVELLLVQSVEEALSALRGQLPHLILTPTLLPCRDDTMLTERLRELGEAATHIQRLTTPLFEVEAPRRGRGLSTLRRGKKTRAKTPVGCKAETFAEQLAIYLEGAVAAHRARRGRDPDPAEPAATPMLPEAQPCGDDLDDLSALEQPDDPSPFRLPAPDAFAPATVQTMLIPLPSASVHVEVGVSAVDALPLVAEAVCPVDALTSALAGNSAGHTLVEAPPVTLPAAAELPAIHASREEPTALPHAPELPAIGAHGETGNDVLRCVPQLIDRRELDALEPVRPHTTSTSDGGNKRRLVKPPAAVTPNGRMRRKMMRRRHANDWTT